MSFAGVQGRTNMQSKNIFCVAILTLALGTIALTAHGDWRGQKCLTKLPPTPADVTDVKFNEFFVTPVGSVGLAPTEKLRALNAQRVRMLGYMVRQDSPPPGGFLF